MTSVSCVIITTLIVISLANLILLVHVIMHSMVNCGQRTTLRKIPKIQKRDNSMVSQNRSKYGFVAALVVLLDEDNIEFVCGVAVISKKWAVTAAHCVDPFLHEPSDKVKVVSSGGEYQWYDIDDMVVHEGYKTDSVGRNLAVISVKQFFEEKEVPFAALPSRGYKYLAGSTAAALDWSGSELVATEVRLVSYKVCQSVYLDKVSDGTFCAETKTCFFDSAGFLVQKEFLVGVVSFGVGCGERMVVYTRVAGFEEWFRKRKFKY